jgi:hypothetical protein
VEISAQYRADDGGRVVCFIRDVTERKKLLAQLMQAQKMEAVGTLAGGIAHDFNNLLQAINGYTQVLLLDIPEKDHRRANLEVIQKAGDRAADLVKQLLLFSRKADAERRLKAASCSLLRAVNCKNSPESGGTEEKNKRVPWPLVGHVFIPLIYRPIFMFRCAGRRAGMTVITNMVPKGCEASVIKFLGRGSGG